MAPATYQGSSRGLKARQPRTFSQSSESNLATGDTTVEKLLASKGYGAVAVRPQDTIADAVRVLKEKRIGAVVVTDAAGGLKGILSERDIVRKLADTPGQTLPQLVEENMTREVVTCAPHDLLVTVLQRMVDGRFRHMPVMEDGRLAGMITIGDVVHYRLNELEHQALQMKQMIVG
ncbi:MAG: CBS domain-containing protein [Pseudomonadota bacterium]